jgi:hypothetical protein
MEALLVACGVFIIGVALAVSFSRMKVGDTSFLAILLTPLDERH